MNETRETIDSMHNALRELLTCNYRENPDWKHRALLSAIYQTLHGPMVSISSEQGFPYVTLGTAARPYERRVLTKLGRYYTGINPQVEAPLLGALLDQLHAHAVRLGYVLDKDVAVQLLTGEDLVKAYTDKAGCHSCMTEGASYWTWFYAFNPEAVSLAVTSNMRARALLWTLEDGRKALDRVYPGSGFSTQFLMTWARSQGYLIRETNSAGRPQAFVDPEGKRHPRLSVKFQRYHPRFLFPYTDTFVYLDRNLKNRVLYNYEAVGSRAVGQDSMATEYEFRGEMFGVLPEQETRARARITDKPYPFDGSGHVPTCSCSRCEGEINLDGSEDWYYDPNGDRICAECYDACVTVCDRCESAMWSDDSYTVRGVDNMLCYCEYCFDNHAYSCYGCNGTYSEAVTSHITTTGNTLCEDCSASHQCSHCHEYVDECVVNNTDRRCSNCVEEA